jgi:DNA/RNA-binding domain of Phe-tRNA-synthetase-like protein
MTEFTISEIIKKLVPNFKIGVITYHNIVIDSSPQMLRGRLDLFQEHLMMDLSEKEMNDYEPVREWRHIFKKIGTDPAKYRLSSEALLRRIKKGNKLSSIHSAVDLNNFFSLQYQLPLGIYDLDQLKASSLQLKIGTEEDQYEGLNGRVVNMKNKLVTSDEQGPFGSPIVDSKRTMVTEHTKNALHIVYLQHSLDHENAEKLLNSIAKMFVQLHGGNADHKLID